MQFSRRGGNKLKIGSETHRRLGTLDCRRSPLALMADSSTAKVKIQVFNYLDVLNIFGGRGFPYLTVEGHEEQGQRCHLQVLEEDDRVPAQEFDRPEKGHTIMMRSSKTEEHLNSYTGAA